MALLFTLLVVVGFVFWFLATLPGTGPYSERIARGLFLAAAILWALTRVGVLH